MAKLDYADMAEEIVKAIGGKENVISVTNCITRLRFVLKDDKIPNEDVIKEIKGVKGVMNMGGQYQVIIGTDVTKVIGPVQKITGSSESVMTEKKDMKIVKDDSLWNRFFKMISSCILPMLGPMIAGGIMKGILVILTTAGVLQTTDGTYLILYAAADVVLYFMPIIVGFTCGKVFDCNPYVTAAIGATLVYPNLVAAVAAEGGITFLKIPVASVTYSNTLLPIILASFVASKLEKLAKKFIPSMLQMMFVPAFVLVITVPLTWLAVGPLMSFISDILSNGLFGIWGLSPIIGGILFGACWQLVVLLGLHAAFLPVLLNAIVTQGYDPVNAVLGITVWALAGVALGYSLRQKDSEKRSVGLSCMVSALCGVTEPTIYSIALPDFRLFVCAMIGGGISGGILATLGAKMYAFGGDGLFRFPAMINPEGIDISFYGFIVCALLAFVLSAGLTFTVSGKEKKQNK